MSMRRVAFTGLREAHAEIRAEIESAIERVVRSGWYIGGPEVEDFEASWANYCGSRHCVGVANGLDALRLSLAALDIGAGDEVILASNSYIATVLAVTSVGATPIFVEPDPATFNIDPARVEVAVSPRTRAILPTHLYGQPADLDPLLSVARRYALRVIEDAAQAHGARYKSRRLGSHSDVVCWSFYPTKNLGALGDAGAITTNDEAVAVKIRVLGNYGSSSRYVSDIQGVNSRLDPIQAAVLAIKLKHLDGWNERRRDLASAYLAALPSGAIKLPFEPEFAEAVWHLFVIQSSRRGELATFLANEGIETLVHYPVPPHRQRAYAHLGIPQGALPIAEHLAESVLSLPIGPHLSSEHQQVVVDAVYRYADRAD